jgi:hypothetical protein
MRPLQLLGQLDAPRVPTPEALSDAVADYNGRSDRALVSPHTNEIWALQPDLAYPGVGAPKDELSAGACRIVVEVVRPTPDASEAYDQAWGELSAALDRAGYPLRRVAYYSRYGSGSYVSFWLAHDDEQLRRAESLRVAAARVLGDEEAAALFARLEAAVATTASYDAVHRRDLDGRITP